MVYSDDDIIFTRTVEECMRYVWKMVITSHGTWATLELKNRFLAERADLLKLVIRPGQPKPENTGLKIEPELKDPTHRTELWCCIVSLKNFSRCVPIFQLRLIYVIIGSEAISRKQFYIDVKWKKGSEKPELSTSLGNSFWSYSSRQKVCSEWKTIWFIGRTYVAWKILGSPARQIKY